MKHLKKYLDDFKCWQLLDEIAPDTPPSKISSHNVSLAQRKAAAVHAYCETCNRTHDKASFARGWSSEQCAEFAGSMSGGISRATVYNYWEEHEISTGRRSKEVDFDPATNNGAGTFTIDHRGQHERDWLLNEEGHLRQFEDHISNNLAKISVDYMATWVNDTLLSDLPVEVSDRHGLYRPIRRKTVHDWMGRAGAKNEVYQKSYYNDKH